MVDPRPWKERRLNLDHPFVCSPFGVWCETCGKPPEHVRHHSHASEAAGKEGDIDIEDRFLCDCDTHQRHGICLDDPCPCIHVESVGTYRNGDLRIITRVRKRANDV